jgi:hypothetical protein
MLSSIPENVSKELTIPKDVLNSFELKDELNPNLWDGFNLKPSIRIRLIKVANDFFKELNLDPNIKLKDILFTGSLANYNWSKFSDIDLHLVLDFSQVKASEQIKDDFFHLQKSTWNDKHDIKLFGFPIEIYAQDIKHKLTATAIYSVKRDKWILKPQRETFKLSKKNLKAKAERFIEHLKDLKDDYQNERYDIAIAKADRLKDKIKTYRLSGLANGGEFSLENLVFKVLRRTPYMDILSDIKANAYDKMMSLNETEGLMSEGQVFDFQQAPSNESTILYDFKTDSLSYQVVFTRDPKNPEIYDLDFWSRDHDVDARVNKGLSDANSILATLNEITYDAVKKFKIPIIAFNGITDRKEHSQGKSAETSIRTEMYIRYIKQNHPSAKITIEGNQAYVDMKSVFPQFFK